MPDGPENPLTGTDRARLLPEAVRSRLEAALVADADGGDRPLEPGVADRLGRLLADPVAGLLDGADAPRPLPEAVRARLEATLGRRGRRWWGLAGAAAAVAVLAAGGLVIATGGDRPGPVVAGPVRPGATSAAAPRAAAGDTSGQQHRAGASGAAAPPASVASPAAAGAAVPGTAPPVPTVSGLDPVSGPSTGGTWVTVSGAGFAAGVTVRFGETAASAVVVDSAGSLRALAPPHPPATVDVTVTGPAGTSAPGSADRFTYLP